MTDTPFHFKDDVFRLSGKGSALTVREAFVKLLEQLFQLLHNARLFSFWICLFPGDD